jgi:hypothetical protein
MLTDRFQRARNALETLSYKIAEHLPEEVVHLASHLDKIAPWGIFLAYSTAVTYMRLCRETANPDSLEALQLLKQTLRTLDRRWKAAGTYFLFLAASIAYEFRGVSSGIGSTGSDGCGLSE